MVTNMSSLKRVLRSNNWQKDLYSNASPWNAICSRGDLDPTAPLADGCLDAKVTSYKMALDMKAEAVSGPTTDGVSPFKWSNAFDETSHRGMPDEFDFAFELQSP